MARENLGTVAGLLAAAALMLDYVLAGGGDLGRGRGAGLGPSAAPAVHAPLCLAILAMIMVNLGGPGVGPAFLVPTYLFIASLLGVLGIGLVKTRTAGGTRRR